MGPETKSRCTARLSPAHVEKLKLLLHGKGVDTLGKRIGVAPSTLDRALGPGFLAPKTVEKLIGILDGTNG